MKNGTRVGKGIRAGKDGGIPWFVFADPSQPLLRVKPTEDGSPPAEDAPLQRRKDAILATANGPDGNVGCPMSKAERAHFHDMLVASRISLTNKELEVIAKDLLEYARATIGERADQ
ncbi:MAG: hypothetical protein GY747_10985 [Planctomycetes bacterium]|nr:hypothetical protein [Planctomycetota bacterium]MCP4772154.1 hypothetical protein [Planctomycetota bacterium]MCP4861385.1 hypothetical protein [Planctomycetota bacterium]